MRRLRMQRGVAIALALVMIVGACGGDDDDTGSTSAADDAGGAATSAGDADGAGSTEGDDGDDDPSEGADIDVDGLVEDLEEQQAAQGGGSATLVVGDQQWTFDNVLCAFGEEQIGQEGAEFVLSSIQDGLQMYASIDSFGHSVTLDDIEDFENPSVSLSADKFSAQLNGTEEEFLEVDGKNVLAQAMFVDGTTDGFEGVEGTFTATCP